MGLGAYYYYHADFQTLPYTMPSDSSVKETQFSFMERSFDSPYY